MFEQETYAPGLAARSKRRVLQVPKSSSSLRGVFLLSVGKQTNDDAAGVFARFLSGGNKGIKGLFLLGRSGQLVKCCVDTVNDPVQTCSQCRDGALSVFTYGFHFLFFLFFNLG